MNAIWQSYINGLLVAAGLIMAIGAQNAFVLAQSLRREHHLPVAALCIVCDVLLVSLGVFGLAALLASSPLLLETTRWGGVVFLLWYGTLALRVLDLVVEDAALGEPLAGSETYLGAEVRFAVLNEAALHVDDVLTRRTHIAFEAADRGRRAVEDVARLMAAPLDWDEETLRYEVEHYLMRLDAESAAQAMLDDAAADAARAPVRDVRLEHERGNGAGPR